MQVGLVRGDAPGAGHRLVEGGVDAAVGADLLEEAVAVGGAELLDLAVREQVVDDRVLAGQLLEAGGVRGEARLGLLLRRQAEASKRISRSCGVELTLKSSPGRLDDAQAVSLDIRGKRRSRRRCSSSRSTPTPTSSIRARTPTSGTSMSSCSARRPRASSAATSGAIKRSTARARRPAMTDAGLVVPSRSSWPSAAASPSGICAPAKRIASSSRR